MMNYEESQESKKALEQETFEPVEAVEEHHKFKSVKTWGIVLAIVLVVAILGSVLFSGSSVEKILRKAYGIDDLKVVETYKFTKEVKGMGSGYTLALVKADGNYGMGLVNVDEGTTKDLVFQYTPLNIVVSKIFESGKSINIEHFNQAAEFIEAYGLECFTTQSTADEYLRRITDQKNGVIPTKEAQQEIIDNISLILPNINKSEEFEVIFNGNTAAPKYYAALGTEMVYNWNELWSEESFHLYVEPFLTQSDLSRMAAARGPVYVKKTVWAVVDSDFNKVGTYASLEEAKKKLMSSSTKKINTKESSKKVYENEHTEEADEPNDINSGVQTLAPSSDKEVVIEKTEPKIFWTMDITYHLENCQAISGVDAEEISWSMAQKIGLRQCPECNPPRYEDYVTETINEEKQQENNSRDVLYRVRKSADDMDSQLGAFENLENAKKLADQHSSDGYKVFDGVGNCVYEP